MARSIVESLACLGGDEATAKERRSASLFLPGDSAWASSPGGALEESLWGTSFDPGSAPVPPWPS